MTDGGETEEHWRGDLASGERGGDYLRAPRTLSEGRIWGGIKGNFHAKNQQEGGVKEGQAWRRGKGVESGGAVALQLQKITVETADKGREPPAKWLYTRLGGGGGRNEKKVKSAKRRERT